MTPRGSRIFVGLAVCIGASVCRMWAAPEADGRAPAAEQRDSGAVSPVRGVSQLEVARALASHGEVDKALAILERLLRGREDTVMMRSAYVVKLLVLIDAKRFDEASACAQEHSQYLAKLTVPTPPGVVMPWNWLARLQEMNCRVRIAAARDGVGTAVAVLHEGVKDLSGVLAEDRELGRAARAQVEEELALESVRTEAELHDRAGDFVRALAAYRQVARLCADDRLFDFPGGEEARRRARATLDHFLQWLPPGAVVQEYCTAWTAGRYDRMYALRAAHFRGGVAEAAFSHALREAADQGGVLSEAPGIQVNDVGDDAASVGVLLTFGKDVPPAAVSGQHIVTLRREGGEWRIEDLRPAPPPQPPAPPAPAPPE